MVVQDEPLQLGGLSVPSMASFLPEIVPSLPGTWHVYNTSTFMDHYHLTNASDINNKVVDLIFQERFWVAVNVKPNATASLMQSLVQPQSTTPETLFNATNFFQVIYETARDVTSVQAAMVLVVQEMESAYREIYMEQYLPTILAQMDPTNQISSLAPTSLSRATNINFQYWDYRSFYNRALMGPLLAGTIYSLTITVFQFLIFTPLHIRMSQLLTPRHIILYRLFISWITFFFLSLFYCTVSAIFQIDFTRAFGRGGFVIYWMTTWLYMAAVGGANENVASLIFTFGPTYFWFWVVSFVILNLSLIHI